MLCGGCGKQNPDGERYCQCGQYLRTEPRPSHMDLCQLSADSFLDALSEGLPLIYSNVHMLWTEANEISRIGKRRAVGILQGFAEEEAAKILLLIDCLRCPLNRRREFKSLLGGFSQHLAKGIYARYYDTSPHDLAEVKHIVDSDRRKVYSDGEYGEYTFPNMITHGREQRLYVSYMRNDDGTHSWHAPYPPGLLDGQVIPSGAITVVEAMSELGFFAKATLAGVAGFWQKIPFCCPIPDAMQSDPSMNISWGQLREYNLGMFQLGGVSFEKGDVETARTLVDKWLFPLYPFELKECGSIADLGPPDSPYDY